MRAAGKIYSIRCTEKPIVCNAFNGLDALCVDVSPRTKIRKQVMQDLNSILHDTLEVVFHFHGSLLSELLATSAEEQATKCKMLTTQLHEWAQRTNTVVASMDTVSYRHEIVCLKSRVESSIGRRVTQTARPICSYADKGIHYSQYHPCSQAHSSEEAYWNGLSQIRINIASRY